LFDTGSLKSLYDFENRENIFPAVDSRMKFCLLTMRGLSLRANSDKSIADFLFFAHNIADLSNSERHFQLSAEDIALINPNTRTCPIFCSKQDAELTKYIYRRVPVLINENDPEKGNPWGISFMRMFDMSNDSHLFKTKQQLEDMGFELQGNHFVKGEKRYLPLYEAKMMHHFNHRFGDYADLPEGSDSTQLPEVLIARLRDPDYEPLPRYWVLEDEVTKAAGKTSKYWLGLRDITNTTNERTVITSMIPYSAVGHTMPLIHGYSDSATKTSLLSMLMNSFVLDWCSRQCVGGTHLTYGYLKQFPFLPPSAFNQPNCLLLGNSLTVCVLELLYTSYSLQPFAKDCGYDGSPFIWDEDRRFEIRCELDALYFHLYLGTQSDWQTQGTPELLSYLPTPRHAVEYIMETFPIVKRKDEKEYGKYRTKLRILEIYDQMTHCLATNTEYRSTLNLPPGPPCDLDGNFIPVDKWDKNNWPQHVHRR